MEQLEIDFSVIDKDIAVIVEKPKKHAQHKPPTVEEDLKAFKAILNRKPTDAMLKTNSFYGNKYIPIEVIERMLSALYLSYNFEMVIPPTIEEGNIIFYINVILKHPITGSTETYTGVSAVPIKPINGTLRDIHPHIPAAKSFAIMNACKHIGRLFRAENDNITNIFDTYFEKKVEEVKPTPEEKAEAAINTRLSKMINAAKTLKALQNLSEKVLASKEDKLRIEYANKHTELSKPKKKKPITKKKK